MATRMQYCPVCQKQTRHEYKSTSVLAALLLLCIGILPGVLYIVYAWRRADRTARCTVDHEAMQRAQRADDMAQLVAAMRAADQPPTESKRGTGFMSQGE